MADGGTAAEAAESSHIELPAEGTGHTVKGMGSCETSKPVVPSIIGPPARPYLLILPKQPPTGAQVFKCPTIIHDPSFMLEQNSIWWSQARKWHSPLDFYFKYIERLYLISFLF